MNVTSNIPCGNGRVLRANTDAIEVELIAYSKGARYTFFCISDVQEAREQLVILRPDRHFIVPDFAHKLHSRIWVRRGLSGEWSALEEAWVEKTPEAVRFTIDLHPGEDCYISTEPPRAYASTTKEIILLANALPEMLKIHPLGESMEHRPILLARVSEPQNHCVPGQEQKPVIHIVCGEHATEFAGEEIGRGILSLVTAQSEEAQTLRQNFIFDFILNANPDGNFHGWHQYNAKDWLSHNYSDREDRSWHHEFVPYLLGEPGDYSSETIALMEWMILTRPTFYISMHSWEGHGGRSGAFYTAPELLSWEMNAKISAINEIAIATAVELGESFEVKASRQKAVHLGGCLMQNEISLAYLPEGHFNWGREKLQTFGAKLLQSWLNDDRLGLRHFDRSKWEALKPSKAASLYELV